jgi:hypothetical protein
MFGLFKPRARQVGAYKIHVFQPNWDECSVDYAGERIEKAHDLLLRGFYLAKTLYTVRDADATALTLAHVARLCRKLDENGSLADKESLGVELQGGAFFRRHSTFLVDVYMQEEIPWIQTHLPSGGAVGEVLASVAAFNLSWLRAHSSTPGDYSAKAALRFFVGLIGYYDQDPLAFTSEQSIYQAPLKAYTLAMSSAWNHGPGRWGQAAMIDPPIEGYGMTAELTADSAARRGTGHHDAVDKPCDNGSRTRYTSGSVTWRDSAILA